MFYTFTIKYDVSSVVRSFWMPIIKAKGPTVKIIMVGWKERFEIATGN